MLARMRNRNRAWLATSAVVAATVVSAAPSASAAPLESRPAVSLATFAGTWIGHTRSMKISRAGLAKESVGDGCCHQIFKAHYRLSRPRDSSGTAIASATVTWVKIDDPDVFTDDFPRPRVGDKTTLRLRKGVLTERSRNATYCAPDVTRCGA